MFLFGWNVHDIAHADDLLARFCGDDALAGRDKKHLITAMDVHFVPCTNTKIDDGKIEVVTHLRRQQRLSRHGTAREQGSGHWLRGNCVGFEYLHCNILLPVEFFMFQSFQMFGTHELSYNLAFPYPEAGKNSSRHQDDDGGGDPATYAV